MCVFCEIVKGNIPSYKVYEDEDVLAILDISQATCGHTLVMPKVHYENIIDMPKELYAKVMCVAKDIISHYEEKLNCKGFNLLNNCGEVAGQSVMHFHVHILPRNEQDDLKIEFSNHAPEKEEFERLLKILKIN